jgi:hypothetical protein
MAGSRDIKVLVPKQVSEDSNAIGDDPLAVLARTIDKEVTSARRARPAGKIAIYVDTTIDYGCLCPPFVFAPFWNSGRPDSYVLPIFVNGVPDAKPAKQGIYRFVGHFDGRRMTGFEWLKLRGEKAHKGMDEYARKAPVFVVEGWCFEPVEAFDDAYAEGIYGDKLKRMAKDGRFCPGTRFPASAPQDGPREAPQ